MPEHPSLTPEEERFTDLVDAFLGNPDVIPPFQGPQPKNVFGAGSLRFRHKIFAMLVKNQLVVKLPKSRVDALVASGDGERFDPQHNGRLMKEWLVLNPTSQKEWLPLAQEAMQFVASKP